MTWGMNSEGQLGDNTQTSRSSPVQTITYGANWKSVACDGEGFNAAIKTDGTLWTWGRNYLGQLGDNTSYNSSKSSPVQTIAFGTNWKQVSCGYGHAAAIKTDGTLWTWGQNYYGELGDNTIIMKSSPVQTVAGGTNWKQVSCGDFDAHTAAIKTDGTLWVWGKNNQGQLCDNTTTNRSSPIQTITFGTNWMQVSCGNSTTAAIKTDGSMWSWGLGTSGQLGDNTILSKSSPVQTITRGTNWKQVAAGYITAAIKTDGTLWTWGSNYAGCLGDNTIENKSSPVQTVAFGTNWKQVAASNFVTAAIKTDGTLWCWGRNNYYGQLGDNTTTNKSSPVQTILYGQNWKSVSCGAVHTAAIQYQDDYQ
jgi:hypothetical protein